jgi:hypothetical protein
MGYDATNYLPPNLREADVSEFLQLLGFVFAGTLRRQSGRCRVFWHSEPDNIERFQPISATLYGGDDGLEVHTRSLVSRNKPDCDVHNSVIRHLRKRFGGHFVSDMGRNRYFRWEGHAFKGAEAGCLVSYWRFSTNLARLRAYLMNRSFRGKSFPEAFAADDPEIVSNNLIVPLLVSLLEEYFKSTYQSLLRFSSKRPRITVPAGDLLGLDGVKPSIEAAVTRRMSFQNLDTVAANFRKIEPSLDLLGCLERPYLRRRVSLRDSLQALIVRRHVIIHEATIVPTFTTEEIRRSVSDLEVAVGRVFKNLAKKKRWHPDTLKWV